MTQERTASGTDDYLEVTPSVRVPRRELDLRFSTSGGPGGQHANTSATRVEISFDVASSSAFSRRQRERVIERLGKVVRVVASDERSQVRNRSIAEQRLAERLRGALRVERPRRATRPTRGSVERRLTAKQRRSDVKRDRRRPID